MHATISAAPLLRHLHWHGLTPTGLTLPFFMFIMGVSTFMSLRKFNFEPSRAAVALRFITLRRLFGYILYKKKIYSKL